MFGDYSFWVLCISTCLTSKAIDPLPSRISSQGYLCRKQRQRKGQAWFLPIINSGLLKWSGSCSVMSDSLQPHGLYSPWNSPGQNTGVGSLSLLEWIVPTQGSNPGLPHCRWILCQLIDEGKPWVYFLEHSSLCVQASIWAICNGNLHRYGDDALLCHEQ